MDTKLETRTSLTELLSYPDLEARQGSSTRFEWGLQVSLIDA